MRSSKADKWICIISLAVFVYSFFIQGGTVVYWEEGEIDGGIIHRAGEVKGIEYPTAIIICPIIFFMFFCFMLFEVELKYVTVWNGVFLLVVGTRVLRYQIRRKLEFK